MRILREQDLESTVNLIVDQYVRTGIPSLEPAREQVQLLEDAIIQEKRKFAQAYLDGLKKSWQQAMHITNTILSGEQRVMTSLLEVTLDNYETEFRTLCDAASSIYAELEPEFKETGKKIEMNFQTIARSILPKETTSQDADISYDSSTGKYSLRFSKKVPLKIQQTLRDLAEYVDKKDYISLATSYEALTGAIDRGIEIPEKVIQYALYKAVLPNLLTKLSAHMYDIQTFIEQSADLQNRLKKPIGEIPKGFEKHTVEGIVRTLFEHEEHFRSRFAKKKIYSLKTNTDDGITLNIKTDTDTLKIAVNYAMKR